MSGPARIIFNKIPHMKSPLWQGLSKTDASCRGWTPGGLQTRKQPVLTVTDSQPTGHLWGPLARDRFHWDRETGRVHGTHTASWAWDTAGLWSLSGTWQSQASFNYAAYDKNYCCSWSAYCMLKAITLCMNDLIWFLPVLQGGSCYNQEETRT